MSKGKWKPKDEKTIELVTEFGNIGVVTRGQLPPERTPAPIIFDAPATTLNESVYIICEGFNPSDLCIQVIETKNHGYHCVGGIAIHDIRNPVTNEYEPHYYQAMERME